jgi:hypothetical protein
MIRNFLISILVILFCFVEASSQDQAVLKINRSHTLGVSDVAISQDEKLIVSSAHDHTLKVWDVATGRHGVLDENLDYYIATHNMEFENPAVKGLLYDDLEGLLDGIGARRKLLLIDACHSGEIDKEENVLGASVTVNEGTVKNRGFKEVKKKEGLGLDNSFDLMNELFSDIRKGSGTIVISSASGREFAFESAAWKNGVFTYAFLDGLSLQKADKDNDNNVKVSEIRDYVIDKVVELTEGKQHPTIRKENLEFDFLVW